VRISLKKLLAFLVIGFVLLVIVSPVETKETTKKINFKEFIEYVKNDKVSEVTIKLNQSIVGKFKSPVDNQYLYFETFGDTYNSRVFQILEEHKVTPNYENNQGKSGMWMTIIYLVLMAFLFFFIINMVRNAQSGGSSGPMSAFGKSKAKSFMRTGGAVLFEDVAGMEEVKAELEEVVEFLRYPSKFTKLGGRIPRGILLTGSPGTGKTLLAKATAGEAGVPFFFVSGSDFVEMFVGVGASRVRDLFEQASKSAPCIVFIDEIDTLGKKRGIGISGGNDEREQTLNQLLVEMDGFTGNNGVIVIGATNRSDILDAALLRPGRFDRQISVPLPSLKGREEIFKVHTRKNPLSENVDLNILARNTPGFSGAEIENVVNEAALNAAKKNKKVIEMEDFQYAVDKVLMGLEKKSLVMNDKEKKATAYHEAGHALVGKLLSNIDPIHKVTIIPRGMALGLTQTLPLEDKVSMSKEHAEDLISFLMGGRIAEELVIGQITTGASNDIERASELARKMVCEWGLSEKIGPISYSNEKESFFGMAKKEFSDDLHKSIETEVRQLITSNYDRAKKLLKDNLNTLHAIAAALLEKETISGEDIDKLMSSDK